jgi:hypothetical protein
MGSSLLKAAMDSLELGKGTITTYFAEAPDVDDTFATVRDRLCTHRDSQQTQHKPVAMVPVAMVLVG